MFKAFITLFSEADFLFYILLVLAIGLFIIEMFTPGFGIAGLSGVLMTVATITERCTHGTNTANELLLYMVYPVLIIMAALGLVKLIYSLVVRKKQNNFAMVHGNKVPLTKEGNLDYSFLIGKEGEVVEDLKPVGKVRFEEGTFEVTALTEYFYVGTRVVADRLLDGRVVVRKDN